nr:MFS transporter [Bacillus benzoevorans]
MGILPAKTKSLSLFFLITAIVLAAFNLRPAITSVGPLVGMIQEDVGLVHWSVGLLTSLPLIAFAIISPFVPKIASRLTNDRTLLLGLVVLLLGMGMRVFAVKFFLFSGTLFVGVGIAILNVILPVIVKDKFPGKVPLMTSVYSTSMGVTASLASGLSIPLASGLNLGWKSTLIIWGIPVVIAVVIWCYVLKYNKGDQTKLNRVIPSDHRIWRSSLAWQIALFMGFQSFLFYDIVAWLPAILNDKGVSMGTSGWLLSFTQFIGLPFSFIVPVMAGRFRSQQWIVIVLGLCSLAGFGGLWLDTSFPILILCIVLLGIGLGGSFPLALTFIAIRARDVKQAAELSGMSQSIGYVLAAAGPLFIGYLYDLTHLWNPPLITLMLVTILLIFFGVYAGRDRYVY